MGLLDTLNTPAGMGLLSAVAGGLAGARRGTPFNNLGRAGIAGLSGYASANDQIRQEQEAEFQRRFREAQLEQMKNSTSEAASPFGKIMPHNYTPASLAKYQQSKNFADLEAVSGGVNFGNVNPGQFTPESLAVYQQTRNYADLVPFRAPVQVDQGGQKTLFDPGTRQAISFGVSPKVTETPGYAAAVAGAEAGAKEQVKLQAEKAGAQIKAQSDLPRVVDSANFTRRMVDGILKHPAFSSSVGFTWTPGAHRIPGTPQADFQARIDQLKGSAFLEAFSNLKGGGSITEMEGKKAETAINRMSTATSEKEFRQSASDFLEVVNAAEQRAMKSAGQEKPRKVKKYNPATGRIE